MRVVLAQIAEPSRTGVAAYREYHARVAETACRVNARFGTENYRPIILLDTRHEPSAVFRFLGAADVCYVGSLRDGMNLVAKEFVVARDDHRGVLVLSAFAGAARELTAALIINPTDLNACAETVAAALCMPAAEQATRLRVMRSVVARYNTYRWAEEMLTDAARLRAGSATDPGNPELFWRGSQATA